MSKIRTEKEIQEAAEKLDKKIDNDEGDYHLNSVQRDVLYWALGEEDAPWE